MADSPLLSNNAAAALPWSASGYAALGAPFVRNVLPEPVREPVWVAQNHALAAELGLAGLDWDASLPHFAGNALFPGSTPVASVYSGHQFGIWAGQLGDGRALLLGALQTPRGETEVQLKGSGHTPFSRMGDGRAVLRSSIREYLGSEAMHALGIPTTRALALVGSATPVRREEMETAAVLARTAPSFVRFGHFEHFFAERQIDRLRQLADFVLQQHEPQTLRDADSAGVGNPYAHWLRTVAERTASLMAQWLAVGFVHGVMNTDNMSILGLTIDYGPYQFLDGFAPARITNHSDSQGRYTLRMQASIGHWNLLRLAAALAPLLDSQEQALAALQAYREGFGRHFAGQMAQKLGAAADAPQDDVQVIAEPILSLLAQEQTDYSIFWRRLSHASASGDFAPVKRLFEDKTAIDAWLGRYRDWLHRHATDASIDAMLRVNPKYVLRNHLAEKAVAGAQNGDFAELHLLETLLKTPFDEHPGHDDKADFPPAWAADIEVSCSS